MGKSKKANSKSNKEKAFIVSSVKKAKTKPIATNLKKVNIDRQTCQHIFSITQTLVFYYRALLNYMQC